jgi:hypothetical protein
MVQGWGWGPGRAPSARSSAIPPLLQQERESGFSICRRLQVPPEHTESGDWEVLRVSDYRKFPSLHNSLLPFKKGDWLWLRVGIIPEPEGRGRWAAARCCRRRRCKCCTAIPAPAGRGRLRSPEYVDRPRGSPWLQQPPCPTSPGSPAAASPSAASPSAIWPLGASPSPAPAPRPVPRPAAAATWAAPGWHCWARATRPLSSTSLWGCSSCRAMATARPSRDPTSWTRRAPRGWSAGRWRRSRTRLAGRWAGCGAVGLWLCLALGGPAGWLGSGTCLRLLGCRLWRALALDMCWRSLA